MASPLPPGEEKPPADFNAKVQESTESDDSKADTDAEADTISIASGHSERSSGFGGDHHFLPTDDDEPGPNLDKKREIQVYKPPMIDGTPEVDKLIAYVMRSSDRQYIGSGTMALSGGFFRLFSKNESLPNTNVQDRNWGIGNYNIPNPKRICPIVYLSCDQEMEDSFYPCPVFARVIRGCDPTFLQEIVNHLNNALIVYSGELGPDRTAEFWISQDYKRILPLSMNDLMFTNGTYPPQMRLYNLMKRLLPEGYDKEQCQEAMDNIFGEITIHSVKVPSPQKEVVYAHDI